jgi:hypothetical protein
VVGERDTATRVGLAGGAPHRHARNLAVDKLDHASWRFAHGYSSTVSENQPASIRSKRAKGLMTVIAALSPRGERACP